jgi:DNA-binding MarR family transcriptional regulator
MSQEIDQHRLYELEVLKHVEQSHRLSNRLAAQKLGVSLKLAHEILKRMVRKGLLHVNVVHSRRWDYFLTPRGIAEKSRLTMEFLDFSMHFYREARRRSAQLCKDLSLAGKRRVAFLGAGDLAEIAYLGVQEWGLELTAVYDDGAGGEFMKIPVQPLAAIKDDRSDAVIVCLYDTSHPMSSNYLPPAVEAGEKMRWFF